MIDAVLSYHMNPLTCGVAKFNDELARRLGVPLMFIEDFPAVTRLRRPLLSVKWSECKVIRWTDIPWDTYDVFMHDHPRTIRAREIVDKARRVFRADQIGCPSLLRGTATRGAYRVLTFGMAHKLLMPHFEGLKTYLETYHPDYTIELSTAVHEGTPWDETLERSILRMRSCFGDKLRVLGFLGDDALVKELQDCDAVALFYAPALRRNNTTYWAAVEAGKHVFTNRDRLSPQPNDMPPTWDGLLEILHA